MTILHIITRLILGGAQQNTVLCCKAQTAAGHRVVLAYGPIYGPEGSLLDQARASGAELAEVWSLRRAVLPPHDAMCYRALRRLIRRIKPDVVHTHSSKAGIVGRAAAWAEGVPAVIHTVHGLPFHERQWRLVNRAYVRAERWAARRCHRIIGVTQAMCDAFAAQRIGRPEQFAVAPSGIDLTEFSDGGAERDAERRRTRRELGIAEDAPVVGIVARLDKLKGQDDLLDVLPRVAAKHAEVRLLIVGDGWHRAALEERVRREGLGARVVFTGLVPPRRVAALLRAMDVAALPSYQEGQPRTLVQALLCGCAIVGYDAGGIGEVCADGRTGRLVPMGDRQALGQALLDLLDDPGQRQRLADSGKTYARERFDAAIMVRRLEEIYQEVLRGPGEVEPQMNTDEHR